MIVWCWEDELKFLDGDIWMNCLFVILYWKNGLKYKKNKIDWNLYIFELKIFFYNLLYFLVIFNVVYRKWCYFVYVFMNMYYYIIIVVENLLVYFNEGLWWLIINENFKLNIEKLELYVKCLF